MPRTKPPPIVLSISGSDPSGGAGLEADLKVFQRHGVYGTAIPTLLTVQNTAGVRKVRTLNPDFLAEQWQALFDDMRPDAIKIGALGSRRMALRVAALLSRKEAKGIPVILDPVMLSTSGAALAERNAIPVMVKNLFPLCRLITPNIPEFSALCGEPVIAINAAGLLRRFGTGKSFSVLLKGGHLNSLIIKDLLWHHGRITEFLRKRISGAAPHGLGCALAASIAANMAHGKSVETSCRQAGNFVAVALRRSIRPGRGRPVLDFRSP